MKKADIRAAIKADLLDQLERAGKLWNYYKDLIDDYMSMWDLKEQLKEDLNENGVVRTRHYSNGTTTLENSKSTEQLLKVNAQMLKLLESLGLNEPQVTDDDEM